MINGIHRIKVINTLTSIIIKLICFYGKAFKIVGPGNEREMGGKTEQKLTLIKIFAFLKNYF